jgi:hypothetical protein
MLDRGRALPCRGAKRVHWTHGGDCVDRSRSHEGARSCRGPAGYSAEFADEGNVAAFSIWLPGRAGKSTFAGRAKVFGDAVEWVLDGDGPKAAVLRIWRAEMPAEGPEREVQELAVFKITARKSARSGPSTRAGWDERKRRARARVSRVPE